MHMQYFCLNSEIVRSLVWMFAVADHITIGIYDVSGIAMWYGSIRKNYVEHTSCHVTNIAFSHQNSEHN